MWFRRRVIGIRKRNGTEKMLQRITMITSYKDSNHSNYRIQNMKKSLELQGQRSSHTKTMTRRMRSK
jgi:hypothetical protein